MAALEKDGFVDLFSQMPFGPLISRRGVLLSSKMQFGLSALQPPQRDHRGGKEIERDPGDWLLR